MQARQKNLLETVSRVRKFLEANTEVAAGAITPTLRRQLDEVHGRMYEHMVSQNEHKRGIVSAVAKRKALRKRLVEAHMFPIALLVARGHIPDASPESLTNSSVRDGIPQLVAAAGGMAEAARPYEEALIAAGLPHDFIPQLLAARDALDEANTDYGVVRGNRAKATGGVRHEAHAARTILRLLDSMIRNYVEDASLLEEWRSVSHVRAVGSRSHAEPAADIPPETPRPAEAAA